MSAIIGPAFGVELAAAGVAAPIAWQPDTGTIMLTLDGGRLLTWPAGHPPEAAPDGAKAAIAAVEAVFAKHDPAKSAPVPLQDEISPRQFYMQAAIEGTISQAEALAFMASRTLPKKLEDPIGQLPADQQFAARMALMGSSYSRRNPFTATIGGLLGKDAAAMDVFWRAAATR